MSSPEVSITRPRLVVLASGSGTLLASLVEAAAAPDFPATIVAVGADRDCAALERAAEAGIEHFRMVPRDYADRDAWTSALTKKVSEYSPDYVVTAGFMRILGNEFIEAFDRRIINSHPALLPAFPGAHGVRDALAYGVKVTGTTVHLVDTGVDSGPILAQVALEVRDGESEEDLHERIKVIERKLLVDVVALAAKHGIITDGRKARIAQ
ncbi:phosphoribosylglycinamide formyltransferase [Smaragdicoccus niigatensis]|uniref:phosphoribosylglycinamide formyltransferase n=1 Tax=Smaragdicoccus niigatensis TaxID=359359 RepID=UPI0003A8D7EE|nr:phosphoribosylglycinamide formyltransferase [Smaragdicoccus niigatensis]